MRYSKTLPIKVQVLSPRNGLKNQLRPHIDTERLSVGYCSELSDLFQKIKQSPPNLILINQPPDKVLENIASYAPLFQHPYTPIVIVHDQISIEEGVQLLEASFADFMSLESLNQETLSRTCRLLTQSQIKESEVTYLKSSDSLTKVKNRYSFNHYLKSRLEEVSVNSFPCLGLITVDLDNFKAFNQRLGHEAGDQVLRTLCNRILSCTLNLPVFRISGDEFAIIVEEPTELLLKHHIYKLIERLSPILYQPYILNDAENILGTSIGVATAPHHANDVDKLIHSSHLARRKAKKMHGCSHNFFEPGKDKLPQPNSFLEQEIWTAMKAEQFELYYQPRVQMSSGKVIGAEALMRWNHPRDGLIMPDTFIPISESTGQIVPMGFWAVSQAGKDIKAIQAHCSSFQKLGVNLSFRQFQNDLLSHTIQNIIAAESIDTEILEFELTESSLFSDDHSVKASIDQLSQLGIDFSLDDFGTGYSSFSLLQKLPVHALKIDRSFISRIPESKEDAAIVCTIINLAHSLNKQVIAEGVETQAQMEFLIQHGCDQVQGFYYSKPLPLPDFIKMLKLDPLKPD